MLRHTALKALVLLVFSASVLAVAEETVENDAAIDSVLLRLAIAVSDIERSKHFYTYALGYEIGFDGDITRDTVIDQLQLAPGQTVHFTVLRGASEVGEISGPGAMIGLMEIDNPPLPAMQRPGPGTIATGEGVLAIVASDMDTIYERMLELDARVLYPPTKSPDGSESELVVYDPDGLRIHVVVRHDDDSTDAD